MSGTETGFAAIRLHALRATRRHAAAAASAAPEPAAPPTQQMVATTVPPKPYWTKDGVEMVPVMMPQQPAAA
eukprot:1346164-Rhodomonas_salina.2